MKIVVLDGYLPNPGDISWEPIGRYGELTVYDDTSDDQVIERMAGANAVFVNRINLTAERIESCKTLQFIGVFGTGYNNVDAAAATRCGVRLYNIPAYGQYAVAQMAAALLLEICSRASAFDRYIKEDGWYQSSDPAIAKVHQIELSGKTLGVIGLGDIGGTMARIGLALGMKVVAYRRHPEPEAWGDALRFVSLDELLRVSDVISLHCPLNDQSRGMIGREALERMKDGTILINAARGAIVDEAAVIEALDSGKLYAYGADVFVDEPTGRQSKLALHPRCVATPHVGWAARETRERIIRFSGENLGDFLRGVFTHCVNR